MKKTIALTVTSTLAVLIFGAITGCTDDPWTNVHAEQYSSANIEDFHARTLSEVTPQNLDYSKLDIYVDLSDGIADAWATNKAVLTTILNRTNSNERSIFPMGRAKRDSPDFNVEDEDDGSGSGRLAENLMNPEKESKLIYAQIQDNLARVIQNNREAVFISDFEEYKNSLNLEVAEGAIFKEYFQEWLLKGHNINLYRFPYTDKGGHSKNLVIAVFSSSTDKNSKANYQVIRSLSDELNFKPEISFVHNPFKINFQDSISQNLQGTLLRMYESEGHDSWTNWETTLGFENHFLPEGWDYFLQEDFQEFSKGKLSEGLLMNTQANNFLAITELKISVIDIAQALELNSEIKYFEGVQRQIDLTKDDGGNVVWSDKDLGLDLIEEGLEKNTKTLKSKYSNPAFSETYHALALAVELDEKLFKDWMTNDPGRVKVHLNLNPSKIESYYVEDEPFSWAIHIDVSEIHENLDKFDEFDFIDPNGNSNSSLSESLKTVAKFWKKYLLESESRLYTYYITKSNPS